MKIRMLIGTKVAANVAGSSTRYLRTGQVYTASEDWELSLFRNLLDSKLAEEADNAITDDDFETKDLSPVD